jgi:hypothetical protein
MDRTLEALALASLDHQILIKRLASVWCRFYGNSAPTSGQDILDWVREEFGDVVRKGQEKAIRLALNGEVKRQLAIRRRRKQSRAAEDVLELEVRDGRRQRALLESILGAPRKWVSPLRTAPGVYTQYGIYSGLVAAIIPTNIRLRTLKSPSLLIYRQPGDHARSHWIPGTITTLTAAIVWLIPNKAHPLIKMDGVRVQHDGRYKKLRITLPDGNIKSFKWRRLREG